MPVPVPLNNDASIANEDIEIFADEESKAEEEKQEEDMPKKEMRPGKTKPCTERTSVKKANKKAKAVVPVTQVQQKTQFRQGKDFLIADFRAQALPVVDEASFNEARTRYWKQTFPGLLPTLTPDEQR